MGNLLLRIALALLPLVSPLSAHAQRGVDGININGQLLVAARSGNLQRVRDLLAEGARPDTRDRNGDSALNLAVGRGHVEVAEALLEAKANVDLPNLAGVTPLMSASYASQAALVRRLLAAGAHMEPFDRMKKNAAIYAAAQGCTGCLEALLRAGTQVNARLDADLTLLMWAAGSGHDDAAKLLIREGADRQLRDDRGKTAADIAREANHPALANWLQQP